jgi:hypothetical protein
MKHLEPKQIGPDRGEAAQRRGSTGWRWLALAIGITMGAGALGTALFGAADRVSQSEIHARQSAFSQLQHQPLALDPVPAGQVDQALDQMKLQPNERARLKAMLTSHPSAPAAVQASRPLRLVSMTLWDTHAPDGDVVRVVSGGYSVELVITKAPQTISFPVDASGAVSVIGVHDGGGGITLGLRGPNQELMMPIMSEGQTMTLSVAR